MYQIEDLFDQRSIVGTKLERILEEKSYTKMKLCEDADISRPTLDRMLSGTLTNKTNYEKHISKIMNCLGLTPDLLLGRVQNGFNQVRAMRSMMKISSERISENTGISLDRLREIEAGEDASLAELRDIAWVLETGVRCLQGTYFFETQIAEMNIWSRNDEDWQLGNQSKFWGHIGILPDNRDNYLWFPITRRTRDMISHVRDENYLMIPCMNNKVLLLNMENIKELMLLDEACDEPGFVNWDSNVDCGEIPPVVYEALEDYYMYEDEISGTVMSPGLQKVLQSICERKKWSEETISEIISGVTIYYHDGRDRHTDINFEHHETITDVIESISSFDDIEEDGQIVFFGDSNGAEIMVNMRCVSLIELPLHKIEEEICRNMDSMLAQL